MPRLKLLKDDGMHRRYLLQDGRVVEVEISDDHEITVRDDQMNIIGQFELSYRDDELPGCSPYFHITWMYMDIKDNSYKHQGIGREALSFFSEIYGLPITASDIDAFKRDDGSHLTGDAPIFVQKMRSEGLIE